MRISVDKLTNYYFDSHTHCGMMLSSVFDDKMPNCQDMGGILEQMEGSVINACLCFPFPDDFIGCEVLSDSKKNQYVRDIFEKIPYKYQNERLIYEAENLADGKVFPLLMFSLKYAIDEQLDFLEEMQAKHYLYGLKYYPEADNLPFNKFHENGYKFIEFLLRYNLPLVVHSSACTVSAESGLSFPGDILKLALKFPELRICIAHMGHFSRSVFDYLRENRVPNLFFDTSPFVFLCMIGDIMSDEKWMPLNYKEPLGLLEYLVEEFGDNIMWGSDYPFNYTCNILNESHDKNYSKYSYKANMEILTSIKKEYFELITHRNVVRFIYGEN